MNTLVIHNILSCVCVCVCLVCMLVFFIFKLRFFQVLIIKIKMNIFVHKNFYYGLGWVAQLVRVSFCTPKDCGFNSQSGHIPRLWRHVQKATDWCFSLSPYFTPSHFKIDKHILRWILKKKQKKSFIWIIMQVGMYKYWKIFLMVLPTCSPKCFTNCVPYWLSLLFQNFYR
jgi:hypothetical protein